MAPAPVGAGVVGAFGADGVAGPGAVDVGVGVGAGVEVERGELDINGDEGLADGVSLPAFIATGMAASTTSSPNAKQIPLLVHSRRVNRDWCW
jgi:hypothetical protein